MHLKLQRITIADGVVTVFRRKILLALKNYSNFKKSACNVTLCPPIVINTFAPFSAAKVTLCNSPWTWNDNSSFLMFWKKTQKNLTDITANKCYTFIVGSLSTANDLLSQSAAYSSAQTTIWRRQKQEINWTLLQSDDHLCTCTTVAMHAISASRLWTKVPQIWGNVGTLRSW